jgi:hypothetical protein
MPLGSADDSIVTSSVSSTRAPRHSACVPGAFRFALIEDGNQDRGRRRGEDGKVEGSLGSEGQRHGCPEEHGMKAFTFAV